MRIRLLLSVLVAALVPACSSSTAIGAGASITAPSNPVTLAAVYSCAERDLEIAAFLTTNPTFPVIATLPSGERVYLTDAPPHTNPVHYDGPTCH